MAKIIYVADLHFGYSNRLQDTLWGCKVVQHYAQHHGIDVVIILGDIFHNRDAIKIDVLGAICDFFESCTTLGQRWLAFPGNHDMFLRHSWACTSIAPLRRYLDIITDIKLLMIDDKRFWIVPFIELESAYMKVIGKLNDDHVAIGDNLLTHIGVHGALYNTCFLLKDWHHITFELPQYKFNRVYTGHFHSYQELNKVCYPGSLIPFKFDEGNISHGFLVYDTDTDTHELIDVWDYAATQMPIATMAPNYITVIDDQVKIQKLIDIANNHIRVLIQKPHTDNDKQALKQHLLDLGARSVRWLDPQCELTVDRSQVGIQKLATQSLFVEWLKLDSNAKNYNESLLLELNREVTTAGDELYHQELVDSAE